MFMFRFITSIDRIIQEKHIAFLVLYLLKTTAPKPLIKGLNGVSDEGEIQQENIQVLLGMKYSGCFDKLVHGE